MRRFFIDEIQECNVVILTGADAKHIGKVLRLKAGDHIAVVTKTGTEYEVVLEQIEANTVTGHIVAERNNTSEPPVHVILVQGLPKGDKLELIIQKCTELGIAEIWPVTTERSVVRLEEKKANERKERWQRIAEEAAKQCKRQRIPKIASLQSWEKVLKNLPHNAQGILLWESEINTRFKNVLSTISTDNPVFLFVGPEGGLTDTEVAAAHEKNVQAVTLGPRILRTETAGLAALAIIMYQLGDLGS
jgi:16S rRNA (uracil1498-N3)-methyltransferase